MTTKPTPAQKSILDLMQKGHVLSSGLETKYRPFDMPPEFGGYLHHPHTDRWSKTILISTIKAMLAKGLIAEDNRYICSFGTEDGHETETWRINYKLNLCAHCYEAPIADNGLYCQSCADQIGKEYMDEWSQRVNSAGQQEAMDAAQEVRS